MVYNNHDDNPAPPPSQSPSRALRATSNRRRASPRRGALAEAFDKRWQEVALEWDRKAELTNADVAVAWNLALKNAGSTERFTARHVRLTLQAAREWSLAERAADLGTRRERLAAARLVLAALDVAPADLIPAP